MRDPHARAHRALAILAFSGLVACGGRSPGASSAPREVREVRGTPAPSPQLAGAEALYERGDHVNATLLLGPLIERASSVAERQRAEYDLAKSLYRMGLRAAALSRFEDIARQGAAHAYHVASLSWIGAVLRDLPTESELFGLLDHYDAAIVDDPAVAAASHELRYLFAQRAYRANHLGAAVRLLAGIPANSPRADAARMLEGATRVRQDDAAGAREAFAAVVNSDRDRSLARVAALQLARVEYGQGAYRQAVAAYDRLEPGSPEWLDSLFEASWAHLLSNERRAKALGNIASLRTSYVTPGLYPEIDVLEALLFHGRCQHDRAIVAARGARRSLAEVRRELAPMLALDDEVTRYERGRRALAEGGAVGWALDGDRSVERALAWVVEIEREVALASQLDPSWRTTEVGIDTEQRLALQLAFAQAEAGRLVGARIADASAELLRLSRDATRIELESLDAKAESVRRRAAGDASSAKRMRESVPHDDEHYIWKPIDGDVWPDEVGSLYAPLVDHCQ